MAEFGTDPHIIRRNDGPVTSEIAAQAVDTAQFEAVAYDIIKSFGLEGCIGDQLRDEFRRRTPPNTQFINRRTGLHQKGLVLRTHITRRGSSGQPQHVYVAKELLEPEWILWMKHNHGWLNPCLFGDDEEVPQDPMKARTLIRDLANDLACSIHALMQEGGVIRDSIGQPLADPDSALGRACAYLKRAMPLVPDYGDQLEEI